MYIRRLRGEVKMTAQEIIKKLDIVKSTKDIHISIADNTYDIEDLILDTEKSDIYFTIQGNYKFKEVD